MSEASSIDTPAMATMSTVLATVLATVQRDSQVTLALSEASDNQWPRTMTPMEDYKDSLSLCQSAYCIDFVIPVIGLYFCAVALLQFSFLVPFLFFKYCTALLLSNAKPGVSNIWHESQNRIQSGSQDDFAECENGREVINSNKMHCYSDLSTGGRAVLTRVAGPMLVRLL